jgi:hypothetical protein
VGQKKGINEVSSPITGKKSSFISLFVVLFCSLFVGIWVFRESPFEILQSQIPLGGDGASTGFYLRLLIESNWGDVLTQHIHSSQFGWPGTLDYTNYPSGNLLELVAIKLFSSFTGIIEPSSLIHIFAVIKIIPITLTSYVLFRVLGSVRSLSLVGALAFSTSTFNLIRAEGHFFLGFTWAVPISVTLLYLAFNSYHREVNSIESKSLTKAQVIRFITPSILVGLSSFYFALISLILSMIFIAFILIGQLSNFRGIATNQAPLGKVVLISFLRAREFLLFAFGVSLGLIIQIFPILLRSKNLAALSGIADRSWTESIVFSGSLESFFFDSAVFFLKFVGRPEIANFASTRISWEGSQLGALSGFVMIVCLLLLLIHASKIIWFQNVHLPNSQLGYILGNMKLRFLFLITFFSLMLYLPNPVNFGISQVLPQIRAWGRVSVFLTLCMIAVLLVLIQSAKRHTISAGALIAVLLVVPYFEATNFRNSRPASMDITRVAVEGVDLRNLTLLDMKQLLKEKCSIFQIPVYPYPEFDIPNDSVGDYAGIAIAAQDYGYFKWSSPSIKDTYDWKALQPLVSQSPNFVRVDVRYSLEYGKALGACAALIDRAQLTNKENQELSDLANVSKCFSNLEGEKFGMFSRYVMYKYGSECPRDIQTETINFARSNQSGNYLWKIDQAFGIEFVNGIQMFPTESVINIRFILGADQVKPLTLKFFFQDTGKYDNYQRNVKICTHFITSNLKSCVQSQMKKDQTIELKLKSTDISSELNKVEFSLPDFENVQTVKGYWGVVLVQN